MNKRIKKKFKKRLNLRHYHIRKKSKNINMLFEELMQIAANGVGIPVSLLMNPLKDENFARQLQFQVHYKRKIHMNTRIKKKHKKLMGCSYKDYKVLMGIKKKLSKTLVKSYDYQKYIAKYFLPQCKTETISIIRK